MITAAFALRPISVAAANELRARPDAISYTADAHPGFPCRQCLRDAGIGDRLLLVSHDPFELATPYRSASPIFIHEASCPPPAHPGALPDQLTIRTLSVRAFDEAEMMVDAAVIAGSDLESTIARLFSNDGTHHLHVHNASRGCWAVRVDRPQVR